MSAEHFDNEVQLSQVLPLLCDFKPHQIIIRELPRGQGLLCTLRHQPNILLLVKHVHQHLETGSSDNQSVSIKRNSSLLIMFDNFSVSLCLHTWTLWCLAGWFQSAECCQHSFLPVSVYLLICIQALPQCIGTHGSPLCSPKPPVERKKENPQWEINYNTAVQRVEKIKVRTVLRMNRTASCQASLPWAMGVSYPQEVVRGVFSCVSQWLTGHLQLPTYL